MQSTLKYKNMKNRVYECFNNITIMGNGDVKKRFRE